MGLGFRVLAVAAAAQLLACSMPTQSDVPAVITNPSNQSRTDLRLAVERALNRSPILLADDALTHDSVLIIDRVPQRDSQGVPLSGREVVGRPEMFRLYKSGKQCVLVHADDGIRQVLKSTTCEPAKP
jgi:hypothetical protein